MGTKYTTTSVSGYNATPPSDDGTASEANKVKWSTIKTKLSDAVKTALESIDSKLTTHFNTGPTALTTNTTLGASHHNQFIQVSGSGVTLTLSDAATLAAGWYCWIRNTDASNSVTIGRATGADTFNGTAANYTLRPNEAVLVAVNAAANGFMTFSLALGDAQTIGGVWTFSGANTHSGANTFSGNNTHSGTETFNGALLGTYAPWSTGDVKLTLKSVADTSWVLMNDGTIGNAASGATTRANADTEALFTLLWTNIIDAWAPVSTGRGASAAADYAANKTITLPRTLGRALAVSGSGATLTARVLGEYLGAETHTLVTGEMPSHAHAEYTTDGATGKSAAYEGSGTDNTIAPSGTGGIGNGTLDTGSAGGGGAHNNMQPSSFFNVMIKL